MFSFSGVEGQCLVKMNREEICKFLPTVVISFKPFSSLHAELDSSGSLIVLIEWIVICIWETKMKISTTKSITDANFKRED